MDDEGIGKAFSVFIGRSRWLALIVLIVIGLGYLYLKDRIPHGLHKTDYFGNPYIATETVDLPCNNSSKRKFHCDLYRGPNTYQAMLSPDPHDATISVDELKCVIDNDAEGVKFEYDPNRGGTGVCFFKYVPSLKKLTITVWYTKDRFF